nr:hypothetical protein [Tanacetum cinerariifolium]
MEDNVDWNEGPWSPEEDDKLLNLFEKHDRNWSLISKYRPGRWISLQFSRMYSEFKSRWDSTLKAESSLMTNEDIII